MHDTMRTALEDALKARDDVAVSALRAAIAALDNADEQARDVVAREIEERRSAATAYDGLGREETAARLRAEADVLAAL